MNDITKFRDPSLSMLSHPNQLLGVLNAVKDNFKMTCSNMGLRIDICDEKLYSKMFARRTDMPKYIKGSSLFITVGRIFSNAIEGFVQVWVNSIDNNCFGEMIKDDDWCISSAAFKRNENTICFLETIPFKGAVGVHISVFGSSEDEGERWRTFIQNTKFRIYPQISMNNHQSIETDDYWNNLPNYHRELFRKKNLEEAFPFAPHKAEVRI